MCGRSGVRRLRPAATGSQARPAPWGGSVPVFVKKVFLWGGVAFLIYFVAFQPDGAAQVCKSIGGGLMAMAQGMGDFLTSLTT
ncbi:hypothetical protein MCAG_02304 [Micromonospora sp. ATCC 39149]|nr:hypothetical protein MCAG_02304 [Micromonospora sp. ATCC 39149]